MNPLKYLHLQLRLEGKTVVSDNLLKQVELVPGEEIPLMVLAQLANGQVIPYYDESLPSDLHAELAQQVQMISFPTIEPLLTILKEHTIACDVGHYKTYLFPMHIMDAKYENVRCFSRQDPLIQAFGFGEFAENVYAVKHGERVVSACVSARENGQCGEAWVFTDETYRKQGFAQQAVGAWAQAMIRAGKVPFYSHLMENKASANLAKRLRLQPVFEEIAIAYMNV